MTDLNLSIHQLVDIEFRISDRLPLYDSENLELYSRVAKRLGRTVIDSATMAEFNLRHNESHSILLEEHVERNFNRIFSELWRPPSQPILFGPIIIEAPNDNGLYQERGVALYDQTIFHGIYNRYANAIPGLK